MMPQNPVVFVVLEVAFCLVFFSGIVLLQVGRGYRMETVRSRPFILWLGLCVVVLGAFFAWSVSVTGAPR
jgi:hypothetical protein